ncbi:hypothetical protein HDU76_007655 [Blyttiomyces sp. JEL0837]|nr:hypothetical protein HDU76_007655 [Blyttiomyces sp. JEL0837]
MLDYNNKSKNNITITLPTTTTSKPPTSTTNSMNHITHDLQDTGATATLEHNSTNNVVEPNLLTMPLDIIIHIMAKSLHKPSDISALARTCRRFHQVFQDDFLWRRQVMLRFGKEYVQQHTPTTSSPSPSTPNNTYLTLYKSLSLLAHDSDSITGRLMDPDTWQHWHRIQSHGSISPRPWFLNFVQLLEARTTFKRVPEGRYRPLFRIQVLHESLKGMLLRARCCCYGGEDLGESLETISTCYDQSSVRLESVWSQIPESGWIVVELPVLTIEPAKNSKNRHRPAFHDVTLELVDTAVPMHSKYRLYIDAMGLVPVLPEARGGMQMIESDAGSLNEWASVASVAYQIPLLPSQMGEIEMESAGGVGCGCESSICASSPSTDSNQYQHHQQLQSSNLTSYTKPTTTTSHTVKDTHDYMLKRLTTGLVPIRHNTSTIITDLITDRECCNLKPSTDPMVYWDLRNVIRGNLGRVSLHVDYDSTCYSGDGGDEDSYYGRSVHEFAPQVNVPHVASMSSDGYAVTGGYAVNVALDHEEWENHDEGAVYGDYNDDDRYHMHGEEQFAGYYDYAYEQGYDENGYQGGEGENLGEEECGKYEGDHDGKNDGNNGEENGGEGEGGTSVRHSWASGSGRIGIRWVDFLASRLGAM